MTAKEWYYQRYAKGSNDDNGVLDGWFNRMEQYAQSYHESEVKKLNKSDVSGRVCDSCGSEMRLTEEWYCDKCDD